MDSGLFPPSDYYGHLYINFLCEESCFFFSFWLRRRALKLGFTYHSGWLGSLDLLPQPPVCGIIGMCHHTYLAYFFFDKGKWRLQDDFGGKSIGDLCRIIQHIGWIKPWCCNLNLKPPLWVSSLSLNEGNQSINFVRLLGALTLS
jgi:hypothetical protein